MFNRVMLAGRLTKAPEPLHSPERGTELELEVDHVQRWGDGKVENCNVRVRVLGAKRAEVLERWMEAGRPIQISGHLGFDDKGLLVEAEQWQFMNNDVVSYAIGVPGRGDGQVQGDGPQPGPGRTAGAAPETKSAYSTRPQATGRPQVVPAGSPPASSSGAAPLRRSVAAVGAGSLLPGSGHAF